MEKLRVDVWSDIACPWCYVGKRHLEAAIARFAHGDRVEVIWRAFELDPSAPRVITPEVPYAERLARKYGTGRPQAEEMIQRMTDVAAKDGLEFRFDRIRPGNTFDAHRLSHLARARGRQDALEERLFRAYLTEGEAVGEHAVLARLGAEAGLSADDVDAVLSGDGYAREVRDDEAEAADLGITGVPFFVVGERYGLSGAQPAEVLLRVIEQTWQEQAVALDAGAGEGAVCGPEGCG